MRDNITGILRAKRTWLTALFIGSLLYLVSFVVYLSVFVMQHGIEINPFPSNGTFQLYNPLRRLSLGQIAGLDFPFFHGVGVVVAHFPLFSLLGGDLFAAEMTKVIMSPLFFIASSALFFYALFRDAKKSVIATAMSLLVANLLLGLIIYAGNSLLGVRSTFPILVAAALLWESQHRIGPKGFSVAVNEFVALVLLGIGISFGTEQASATILSYFLVKAVVLFRKRVKIRQILAALALAGSVIVIVGLIGLTVFTLGHPWAAITYTFFDIPADQGWYFGADPNTILSLETVFPKLFAPYALPLHVITLVTVVLCVIGAKMRLFSANVTHAFVVILMSGMIAFVVSAVGGYYEPISQLMPFLRAATLVSIGILVKLAFSEKIWPLEQSIVPNQKRTRVFQFTGHILVTGLLASIVFLSVDNTSTVAKAPVGELLRRIPESVAQTDHQVSSGAWRARMDAILPRIDEDATVWSLYTSTIDSEIGKLNPATGGEDYIIHALGDDRRAQYVSDFVSTSPDFVVTLNPEFFWYEEWLWHSHWDFYSLLFTEYTISVITDTHILWEKDNGQLPQRVAEEHSGEIEAYQDFFPENTTNRPKIYSTTVRYSADAGLPLSALDKFPRYLVEPVGASGLQYAVSLPHQRTEWTFPVIVMPGEDDIHLEYYVDGIFPTANLEIDSISFQELYVTEENHVPLWKYRGTIAREKAAAAG